jgi:hypothetical protein
VQVLLAQSQLEQNNLGAVETQVKSALAGTSDNLVRAVAHNTLGEYYLRGKQEEEAFWQFLRVDVLYNQDKAEHAKALYHLSKLFDRPRNDPARARECRDRLLDKQFAGTEYQRRAESEK